MRLHTIVLAVATSLSAAALAGCASTPGAAAPGAPGASDPQGAPSPQGTTSLRTPAAPRSNKEIVIEATEALFTRHDPSAIERFFAEPYLQHNPRVKSGLDPLRGLVASPGIVYSRSRALAEGDLVVTHSRWEGFGPKPVVGFDIFRLKDGKIVEHWDIIQPVADKTVSGRTQLDGPTEVVDLDKTAANKALVKGLLDDVFFGHKMDKIGQYISTERYDQHNPGIADGLDGLGKAMAQMAKAGQTMVIQKTHRVVAEGNFVFLHSEGTFAGKHVAFADLMRVENGKIVEHWDTIQDVPEATASGLGMF